MLSGSPAVALLQNYLRSQEGVIEVARAAPDQLLLTVGERVQATVTGQLPNGRFAVLIKDQLLDLNLPRNTQPGEKLDLLVAAKEPRLTFLLSPPATSESKTQPGTVALSQAGQLLGELLSRKESESGGAARVQQTQPLFEGNAVPQPEKLAAQLATRLSESGLFYESHQAEWVKGQRPLQTLLREPQAQWHAVENGGKSAALPFPGRSSPLAESVHASMLQPALPESAQSTGGGSFLSSTALPAGAATAESGVRHLVQQQMQLLENHPLLWQGQAWPGQPLNWQLALENERDPAHPEAAPQAVWQTRLEMTLPRLGTVAVIAALRDGQFYLRFEAGDAATVSLLRSNQSLLGQRFEAAGLVLSATQVVQHDDATAS